MNPIPIRLPVIGIALAAMLIVTFAPSAAEAQIRQPAKAQAATDVGHKDEIDVLAVQAKAYDAIVATARRIHPKSLSPRDIEQFNARMAPVRRAFQSWAARYDVDFVTKSFSPADAEAEGQSAATSRRPETRPNVVASCPSFVRSGEDDCELIGATVDNGELICEYHCSKSKDLDRQGDDQKVMQQNQ